MNTDEPQAIIPAAELRRHVERLDAARHAEREQQQKAIFRADTPGDAEALDDREKQLINRGLELALLGRRVARQGRSSQQSRQSRRERRQNARLAQKKTPTVRQAERGKIRK